MTRQLQRFETSSNPMIRRATLRYAMLRYHTPCNVSIRHATLQHDMLCIDTTLDNNALQSRPRSAPIFCAPRSYAAQCAPRSRYHEACARKIKAWRELNKMTHYGKWSTQVRKVAWRLVCIPFIIYSVQRC